MQHLRPTAGSRGGKAKGPYHSNVLNTSYKRPFGGVQRGTRHTAEENTGDMSVLKRKRSLQ